MNTKIIYVLLVTFLVEAWFIDLPTNCGSRGNGIEVVSSEDDDVDDMQSSATNDLFTSSML